MALVLNGSNNTVAGLAVGGLPDGSTDADALASNAVTNVKVADDAIGVAELSATGTASSSTYLRGDNSWATVSAGAGGATALSLNDGVKVNFGADNDLRIEGGSGNSVIQHQDTAAGDLFIDAQNSSIYLRSGDGSTGEQDAIVCQNNGKIMLKHAGTLVAETSANGLAFPSGKGIDFSATSDAGTVDSEVLSDYENGEWTPTAKSSVTLSTAKGYYTRIGHRVICDMFLQVDNDNSNTSFTITNLPYAGGNGWDLSVPAIRIASWDLPSGTLWVSGHTGASEMAFHCNKDNANYVALPADSGGSMIVSFAYEVA